MDSRTTVRRVTERERLAAENLMRSAREMGYVLDRQRAVEVAREVIEDASRGREVGEDEEDEEVPSSVRAAALAAFGARPRTMEAMSGVEWARDVRGDTVTLLRWAVHVPTGRWFLVPADSPSAMVW